MILRQIYNYFFGTKAKPMSIDYYLPTIPVQPTTIPPIGIIEFNELPYDDDVTLVEINSIKVSKLNIVEFDCFGYAIKLPSGDYLDLDEPKIFKWHINSVDFIKNCISDDLNIIHSVIKKYDKGILL